MNLDRPTEPIVSPPGIGGGWPPMRPRANDGLGSVGACSSAAQPDRPSEASRRFSLAQWARREFQRDGIWLVPLRFFIAAAWLMAFAEKVGDPAWYDGTGVSAFVERQLADGRIPFPLYCSLLTDVVLANATTFGWIVLVGQCLAGIALLLGAVTNAALLCGLAMNLAVLLAGETEPAIYFIPVQAALLATNAGATLGIDAWLGRIVHRHFLVAQPASAATHDAGSWVLRAGGIALASVTAVYAARHVADWHPAQSDDDPAAIVVAVAVMAAVWFAIGWVRAATSSKSDWTDRAMDADPGWPSPIRVSAAHAEGEPADFDRLGAFDLEWGARAPREQLAAPSRWRP